MENEKICPVCESSMAEQPEAHYTYVACVNALKAKLARFLADAGAVINKDGDIVFSSAGYGAWTRRKGDERTREILAENEQLKANQSTLLDAVHHLDHCLWCAEGTSCDEGKIIDQQIRAIEDASHQEPQPAVATFAPGCECGNCKEARAREQAK